MQCKPGFMLREIAGQWVVVPIGEQTVEYAKIITLSESGALLWKTLEQPCEMADLLERMKAEYEVDDETAKEDILAFVQAMDMQGLLMPEEEGVFVP